MSDDKELDLARAVEAKAFSTFDWIYEQNHSRIQARQVLEEAPFFLSLSDEQKVMYSQVSRQIAGDAFLIMVGILEGQDFDGFSIHYEGRKLENLSEDLLVAREEVQGNSVNSKPAF